MRQQAKHLYQFGSFLLDPGERRLLRDGKPMPLTPKALETLMVLVQNSGHLMEKDELLKQVWPDTFVEEATLAKNVFTLRKVLGDTAEEPTYIETVAKGGYRFIAPVNELGRAHFPAVASSESQPLQAHARRWARAWIIAITLAATLGLAAYFAGRRLWPRPHPTPGRIMLAVLPFENLSGDPEQEYFSEGLTEEMITQLGRLEPERLGVIARTSTMQYKHTQKRTDQIGRELGVAYILEGSVRREGDRVRISAQLIEVRDQIHVWAEDYDRDVRNILSLQSDVTGAIARAVEIKLTPQQQVRLTTARAMNPEAYQLYLKGRYFWNKRSEEGYMKAIESFEQAITKQPDFAQAYAGLADAYALLGSMSDAELPRSEAMPRAKAAALKALEMDDTLAEAHSSLAFVRMHFDWDWSGAEKEFKRATELNPGYATAHHWYAYYFVSQGRTEDAVREIRLAQQSDPLSLIINTDVAEMLYYARRYDEAIDQARRTLEMDPGFALAHHIRGMAYLEKHQYAEGITELQAAVRLGRADLVSSLGLAYARAGRREEALKIVEKRKRESRGRYDMSALSFSWTWAALGQRDQAFSSMEEAYQRRDGGLILLKVLPYADPLRSDARFTRLLRRIGLPP